MVGPKLNTVLMARAMAVAEELFLSRLRPHQIITVLQRPETAKKDAGMGLSKKDAVYVVRMVKEMWKAESEEERTERRSYMLRSLDYLYTRALAAKDFKNCLEILRTVAKLEGTLTESVSLNLPSGIAKSLEEEFEGRSPGELEFFANHGRYPEDTVQ